jgi:hypothetical protein
MSSREILARLPMERHHSWSRMEIAMKRWSFALGAAILALGAGTALAAVDQDAANRVAACGKLPLSERGICKHEALGVAPTPPPLSVAERAKLMTEETSCDRLPRHERVACKQATRSESQASAAPDDCSRFNRNVRCAPRTPATRRRSPNASGCR